MRSGGRHAARDRGAAEVSETDERRVRGTPACARLRRADRGRRSPARRSRASRRAFRPKTSSGPPAARGQAGHSASCSSRRSITFRRRWPTATRWRRRWNLNLINLKAPGAVNRPVADEHGRLLRAPQGGTALRRARGVRHLVHGASARPVAVARQPSARRAVHAEERHGCCARSARSRNGR